MRNSRILLGVLGSTLLLMGCPPTYPKCESDEHCKEKGEVCVQGMCRECATDANCKEGFVCDANRCVPKPECTDDKGCGEGKKCKGGKCQVAEAKPECSADDDCPSGQGCKAGKCAAVEAAVKCSFEAVRFDFNEYSLTGPVQSTLTQYADCIKKGSLRFTLEGHADERGTEEYNMVLSQKRAASVRKYLVDLGASGGALDTVGYGENKPAVSGSNEEAWAANRRVEFRKR
ncbi:MAG: OmpA family protein [Myxococcales bacterium]|nr:OmpA family protein [Myxococcales bacterium]